MNPGFVQTADRYSNLQPLDSNDDEVKGEKEPLSLAGQLRPPPGVPGSADIIYQLARKYSPVLVFDQDEPFYPMSTAQYLSRCSLMRNKMTGNNSQDEVLVAYPDLTEQELSRQVALEKERLYVLARADPKNASLPDDVLRRTLLPLQDCYIKIQVPMNDPVRLEEERQRKLNLCADVPIYVAVLESEEYWDITYNAFYEYNGATGFVCGLKLGFHEADLEHVTARIRKDTTLLEAVFFSSHRVLDGEWRYVDRMKKEEGPNGEIHPVVCVALNSHSNYPSPGTRYRILGFANDLVNITQKSITWRPNVMLHLADMDWSDYDGYWGGTGEGKDKGSVHGFAGSTQPGEPSTSDTACRKFWCCCCEAVCCLAPGWRGPAMIFPGQAKKPAREKQGNTT